MANTRVTSIGTPTTKTIAAKAAYSNAKSSGVSKPQATTIAKAVTRPIKSTSSNNNIKPITSNVTPVASNVAPVQDTPANVVNNALKMPTYSATPTTDNTAQYNQIFDAQKEATIARIKNAIAGQISDQSNIIAQAPQRFYDPKNEASFQGRMNEQRVAEQMANMGLAGSGDNITAGVRARAGTQSAINQLNQQQQDVVTNAQNAITGLNREQGNRISEAQSMAESEKIRALIDEANRVNQSQREDARTQYNIGMDQYNTQYGEGRDLLADKRISDATTLESQRYADAKTLDEQRYTDEQFQREQANYLQSIIGQGDNFDYQAEINRITNDGDPSNDWKVNPLKQARQDKVDTNLQRDIGSIGQYSNDYAQEIQNRLDSPDTMDDALIPYLEMARSQKIAGMQSAEQSQAEAERKQTIEAAKLAIEQQKANYETNKPYYNPNTSNKTTTPPKDTYINDLGSLSKTVDNMFVTKEYNSLGKVISTNVNKNGINTYLGDLEKSGKVDQLIIDAIAVQYGLIDNLWYPKTYGN